MSLDARNEGEAIAEKVIVPTALRPGIAVLVDLENLRLRLEPQGIQLWAGRLKALAREAGRPLRCMVFADMSRMNPNRCVELYSAGFILVHCPKLPNQGRDSGKDTVDPSIIAELHDLANRPDIEEILLASADRDFLCAVNTLRDAHGKRVRIITPTMNDRQALIMQSDGAIPYADESESVGFAKEFSQPFSRELYVAEDARLAGIVVGLERIVVALLQRFDVNSHHHGFNRFTDLLETDEDVMASCVTSEAIKDRLDFLKQHGVMADSREADTNRTHYRIVTDHPFVQHVLLKHSIPAIEIIVHAADEEPLPGLIDRIDFTTELAPP